MNELRPVGKHEFTLGLADVIFAAVMHSPTNCACWLLIGLSVIVLGVMAQPVAFMANVVVLFVLSCVAALPYQQVFRLRQCVELSQDFLIIENIGGKQNERIPWSCFREIRRAGNSILFVLKPIEHTVIVPGNAFASTADMTAFHRHALNNFRAQFSQAHDHDDPREIDVNFKLPVLAVVCALNIVAVSCGAPNAILFVPLFLVGITYATWRPDTNLVMAYALRSTRELDELNLDAARRSAERALNLYPHLAHGYWARAFVAIMDCDYDLAIELCEKGLLINRNDTMLWFTLAWANYNRRRPEEAERAFDEAIAAAPNNQSKSHFIVSKALAIALSGSTSRAEAVLSNLPRVDRDLSATVHCEAIIQLMKQDYAAAKQTATRFSRSPANQAERDHTQGLADAMLGNVAASIAKGKAAVDASPTTVHMFGYAVALYKNGEEEAALEWLDKAIAKDKYEAQCYWLRDNIRRKRGEIELADEDRKKWQEFQYVPFLKDLFPEAEVTT